MLGIGLGVILIFGGILFMAFQAIWRGPLSDKRRSRAGGATLEPRTPGAGFGLKANWPGFVLIAIGVALLVAAAAL